MKSSDIISWLEKFYRENCNKGSKGKFEIFVTTLESRGWSVTVDLDGTSLSGASCDRVDIKRSRHDWVRCWVKDDTWEAIGGTGNLKEILELLREWVELQHK